MTGEEEARHQRDRLAQYLVAFAGDVVVFLDGIPVTASLDTASVARRDYLRDRALSILAAAKGPA